MTDEGMSVGVVVACMIGTLRVTRNVAVGFVQPVKDKGVSKRERVEKNKSKSKG